MILSTLLLFLAGADPAAPPPPPVVISPDGERRFLASLPLLTVDGRRFRIFAITGTGARNLLDEAAKKLKAEGWDCDVAVDYTGSLHLSVFAQNRSLNDVQRLAQRFSVQEFGAIEAKPMLFPDARG